MATRRRIVRRDPAKKTIAIQAEREADFIFGKARGQVRGFGDFIRSQGVVGLAVGIIIGTSVTLLVGSLVNNIVNPLIGLILPSKNLNLATLKIGSATIGWGSFVSALIDFMIVMAVVYFFFKILKLEKLDKKPKSNHK
jgi:large conductance mechanosensitive channel